MGVYVKGMDMPDMCSECDFLSGLICPDGIYVCECPTENIHGRNVKRAVEEDSRHPDCPLVEVQKPHKKLVEFIDVTIRDDNSKTEEIKLGEAFTAYIKMREAKPVIEAEGEE